MCSQDCNWANMIDVGRLGRKPMTKYTLEFFDKAAHLKNDVLFYRNYVLENGPFIDEDVAPDFAKSNKRASEIRQEGNRLFGMKDYMAALVKYNESICWAESGSEDLGIAYANRSAVYYDNEEYELCLLNINLARRHSYPEKLMYKLLAREHNCKEKISNGCSKRNQRCRSLNINTEVNGKIPFMAAGIVQKELQGYGRSMVADRAFKAGEVILQEKAMLTSISPELKYKNCKNCSTDNFYSLIPCPDCVSVMYCSEDCMKEGYKFNHRFECGLTEKLHHISYGSSRIYMGSKAFFYGLTLFNDNINEMMEYCKANNRTGADPFTLDYTNYDRLEEFKIFHRVKLPTSNFLFEDSFRFYAAVCYSIYIKHPLVRSTVTTETQRDFMLCSILDYMRIIGFLIVDLTPNFTHQLYSIASVCNHSCDPNTVAVTYFGQLKFIVIRPIRKGDQIVVSYGAHAMDQSNALRRQAINKYHFDCLCDVCRNVQVKQRLPKKCRIPTEHLITIQLIDDPKIDDAAKLNILQQFSERFFYTYPQVDYVIVIDIYRKFLLRMYEKEVLNQLRDSATKAI